MEDLQDDLNRYCEWTDDQLLIELGKELLGEGGLGVGSEDPGRHRRFSVGWIEEQREELCTNPQLRQLAGPSRGDQAIEIVTLVQILSTEITYTAAVLAAILIVRTGLRTFCSGCWK
jgi:hypothetical protein